MLHVHQHKQVRVDGGKRAAGGDPSMNHQLTADVSIDVSSDTFLTVERSSEIGAQQREQKEGPHVLHGHRDIGMVLRKQRSSRSSHT